MAGSASIGGLASGLDTATIISQLMQLEAIPQSRLQTQVSTHETALKTMQELNAKVAALVTKAEALAKPDGWSPVTSTSSSEKVVVTTGPGATATSLSFSVLSTAKAHAVSFTQPAGLADVVTGTGTKVTVDLFDGKGPQELETGDGTLRGLVDAVNGWGKGLRATTLNLGDGTYRLRIESAATGTASKFELKTVGDAGNLGEGVATVTGADAEIQVGTDKIKSASNTFTDLLPGVNVTLAADAPAGAVTIGLATDAKKMTASVKELVDAVNGVLADIDKATKAGIAGAKAGPLVGDSTLRSVRDQLLDTLYSTSGGSLVSAGIEVDKYGKLTFDEAQFTKSYEADPVATAAYFTKAAGATGFADRLATTAKAASDPYDGLLSSSLKGRQSTIDRLQDSIENWDIKLELRRTTLTRQFTALETALSRMNSQSSWLAGQISSLTPSSS
ncbi:MAG TPA: flagellar filament capping protein FliD [Marmoricola sp.]|nr:flagellar filament capping protein FliD [Marmoricola sp.]